MVFRHTACLRQGGVQEGSLIGLGLGGQNADFVGIQHANHGASVR